MEKFQTAGGGASPDPNRYLKPKGKKDYWKIARKDFTNTKSKI